MATMLSTTNNYITKYLNSKMIKPRQTPGLFLLDTYLIANIIAFKDYPSFTTRRMCSWVLPAGTSQSMVSPVL